MAANDTGVWNKIIDLELNYDQDEGKELGKGTFGVVVLYTRKEGADPTLEKELAVKLMDQDTVPDTKYFAREIKAMNLEHKNIVRFLGRNLAFSKQVCIIMERCNGNLRVVLEGRGSLGETDALHLLYGLSKGLVYLHENKYIHRDIKCNNVLVLVDDWKDRKNLTPEEWKNVECCRFIPKLADFGFSRLFDQNNTMTGGIGTHYYMAPELRETVHPRYSNKVDVYALGIVLLELLTGKPAYKDRKGLRHRIDDLPDNCAKPMLHQMTEWNSEFRWSSEKLKNELMKWKHNETD